MAVALLALSLAGCGGGGYGDWLVAPGKYTIYNCGQLAGTARSLKVQEANLQGLLTRSSQGPGGDFVGTIAYRSEYQQTQAQYRAVMQAMSDKNCSSQSKWSSERSLF